MRLVRFLPILLVCWLGVGATMVVQDGPPVLKPSELAELLKTAREPRATTQQRREAMETLLAAGPAGAGALATQIEREATRARTDYVNSLPSFLRAYERASKNAVTLFRGPITDAQLEELRKPILANSIDATLTSARIHTDSDPALTRLERLFVVKPHQVFDVEPERYSELSGLMDLLDEQALLHGFWVRAHAVLVEAGATSRARSLTEPHDPTGEEAQLHEDLAVLAFTAMPMSGRDLDTLRANRAMGRDASLKLDPQELAGIERLNQIRILCGLSALAIDPRLCDASRDHSKDMVEHGFFSHTSPLEGKESFGQRAALFGTSASAENIAAGQPTGVEAIEGWWYSPGHHRNMLNVNHVRIGLGRHDNTWTQLFG